MHLGRNTCHLTGKDSSSLRSEFGKNLRIFIADFLKRKVQSTAGHRLIGLTEINAALDGLRLRHKVKKVNGPDTNEVRGEASDDSGMD